jgi:outer membrane protein assembly factor BamE (lipoprotein component of BamABCDE complex)
MYFLNCFLIIAIFLLNGCAETKQTNGISFNKINDFNIEIGKTSKNLLVNRYGPPSFESPFNKSIIYYVSQNTIYKNLDAPKVKKMILYKVNLDKNNIVKDFKKYNEKDIANIEIAKDGIRQNDNKLMILLKEMIGNLQKRNTQD